MKNLVWLLILGLGLLSTACASVKVCSECGYTGGTLSKETHAQGGNLNACPRCKVGILVDKDYPAK